jgi:hypothetical protein
MAAAACGVETSPKERTANARNEPAGSVAQSIQGNIVGAIQIDGPTAGADLFPNQGTPLNSGATLDWVAPQVDGGGGGSTDCIPPTGASGPGACPFDGVTGATGGSGKWNGLRIVDALGAADLTVFNTGGKENDLSTWNIGPGNVGGPKFELTQAYLANSQTTLYLGMERSGNNGTTAFDFEFNQKAPGSTGCSSNLLLPCRTSGDVLFTFEMQGAGNSGSATPFVFIWNGSTYVQQNPIPAGIISSINNVATTDGAPWGHVDDKGNWVLGDMEKFTFAEAAAPLSLLPGVNACGGTAYVQVRTRSSAQDNSDLKDTTKIFEFQFGNPTATVSMTGGCAGTLDYALNTAVRPDGTSFKSAATCAWTFKDSQGNVVGTSSSCSGTFNSGKGAFTGSCIVTEGDASTCQATAGSSASVLLAPTIDIAPDRTSASCPGLTSDAITYTATVTNGAGSDVISWTGLPTGTTCSGTTCTIQNQPLCAEVKLKAHLAAAGGCLGADSEEETYTKLTTISSTNAP